MPDPILTCPICGESEEPVFVACCHTPVYYEVLQTGREIDWRRLDIDDDMAEVPFAVYCQSCAAWWDGPTFDADGRLLELGRLEEAEKDA